MNDIKTEHKKIINEVIGKIIYRYKLYHLKDELEAEAYYLFAQALKSYNSKKGEFSKWLGITLWNGLKRFVTKKLDAEYNREYPLDFENLAIIDHTNLDYKVCKNFIEKFENDFSVLEQYIYVSYVLYDLSSYEIGRTLGWRKGRVEKILNRCFEYIKKDW